MTLTENLFDTRGGPGQADICEQCGEPLSDGLSSPVCEECVQEVDE
jgi:hypothetical protein